jgi:hypothetical protein
MESMATNLLYHLDMMVILNLLPDPDLEVGLQLYSMLLKIAPEVQV